MSEILSNPYSKNPIDPIEIRYLEDVKHHIETQIERMEKDNITRAEDDIAMKEEAWDQHLELKDGAGAADSAAMQQVLANSATVQFEQTEEIHQLKKLWDAPYFGRMDLRFTGEDEETFYVGLRELLDTEAMKQYVIDWRSPVASVYYEDETGDVTYQAPAGLMSAELLDRKQIVINRGKITMVLEGAEQANDEILQLVLSQKAGTRMKQIVSTLQQEQNVIIRAEPHRSALIQGVAGSGKTSIALHRASYLLYRDDRIQSSNMLIISPNPQFSAYISQVLPDLGDENAPAITAEQLMLGEVYDADSYYRKIKFGTSTNERMRQVGTFELLDEAKQFADEQDRSIFEAREVRTQNFTIAADYIDRLYTDNYRALAPFERYRAIVEHLAEDYAGQKFGRNRNQVEEAVRGMYATWSLQNMAIAFYKGLPEELSVARPPSSGHEAADLIILAWLKVRFFGSRDTEQIRHLILDEMQDLLPMQHDLMRMMFPCPKTILGDVNQAVRFTLPPRYLTQLRELYEQDGHLDFYTLNTAYRSTYEITTFSSELIGRPEIEAIERHGEPVAIETFGDADALRDAHLAVLAKWEADGYRQCAVIGADETERAELLQILTDADQFESVTLKPQDKDGFHITVLDPESAKGMEFDCVLVWDASEQRYDAELDRTRLYVTVTRALHELKIGVLGTPSRWLVAE